MDTALLKPMTADETRSALFDALLAIECAQRSCSMVYQRPQREDDDLMPTFDMALSDGWQSANGEHGTVLLCPEHGYALMVSILGEI